MRSRSHRPVRHSVLRLYRYLRRVSERELFESRVVVMKMVESFPALGLNYCMYVQCSGQVSEG